MTDSKQFTEILNKVPRWRYLTPGDKINRDTDQYIELGVKYDDWADANLADGDDACDYPSSNTIVRRPIPESVRRSMAWWALYNQLATVSQKSPAYRLFVTSENKVNLGFESTSHLRGIAGVYSNALKLFPILGGEQEIIKNLSEGDGAYMRWALGELNE
jgi:hypothetical protein